MASEFVAVLATFALRIGVSRSTLQKMEKGDLSVTIGKYYRAGEILGLAETFDGLLRPAESLFDAWALCHPRRHTRNGEPAGPVQSLST